ncbi:MAG: hypothetical protein JXB07_12145, partial [Anaerolineae bacterium]|nr:hypothetical protein [Anaerolineae bacterium]
MTKEAIEYSWRQLAARAGVSEDDLQSQGMALLGIPVYYARPEKVTAKHAAIVIVPCERSAFSSIPEHAPARLDWIEANKSAPMGGNLPFHESLPVLFWGHNADSESTPFAELRSDGTLIFHADIIASALFMLTRWEETVFPVRDEHDRFPATASVAYKHGFLDRPLVDEYALILREWLRVILPGWEPESRSFSVKLSHDIDHLRRFPSASNAL